MGSLSSICCGSRHNSDRHVRGRYREGALALVSAVAMNAFVVSGLVKRRSELAGEIERSHEALRKMLLDLESLDATILQFEPDFKVETIKPKAFRPPKDWSNATACGSFSVLTSSTSPVAIRATMTAAPITLAGRFSPRGPLD